MLNTDDIRTMDLDEALVISKNRHPVKLKILPFYKNSFFNEATLLSPPDFFKNRKINLTFEDLEPENP
ncbi:MAG: hypothetical protein D3903_06860 [Candidatus Electrothrix sp. GM3_4]|nr:hypothetical protein [Candidatus Electrothrix sp. GM3_4]